MTASLPPRITTVIPTYRRPDLLPRAIQSALDQVGAVVRVRVVDNASGDETAAVVAELATRRGGVEYIAHANNIGAIANFEFGVRHLSTDYFSLLSDDDYLLPGFYQRALRALDADPQAMFWIGTTLNVDPGGRIWDARMDRWERDGLYLPPEGVLPMTGGRAPTWTGVVFRSVLLETFGFVDPEVRGATDLDYLLRLAARYPFIVERCPVAVFTLNPASFGATQPLDSFWPGWKKMFGNLDQLEDLAPTDRQRLIALLQADARRMLFRRGVNALAARRHEFARSAATALRVDCGEVMHGMGLSAMAAACQWVPGAQAGLTWLYRRLEKRLVDSRDELQVRYGHLIRR